MCICGVCMCTNVYMWCLCTCVCVHVCIGKLSVGEQWFPCVFFLFNYTEPLLFSTWVHRNEESMMHHCFFPCSPEIHITLCRDQRKLYILQLNDPICLGLLLLKFGGEMHAHTCTQTLQFLFLTLSIINGRLNSKPESEYLRRTKNQI